MTDNSKFSRQDPLPADLSIPDPQDPSATTSETNSQKQPYEEPESSISAERERRRIFLRGVISGVVFTIAVIAAWNVGERSALFFGQREAGVLSSFRTLRKLKQVQHLIASEYLPDIDPELLETYLFKGIAAGLDDPYGAYYSAEEMTRVVEENNGAYYGIGVVLKYDQKTGTFLIDTVYEDGPASEAGIREGDILLGVNDTLVEGMDLEEAIALVRGQNEPFTLLIEREGQTQTIAIKLDQIEKNTVTGEMLQEGVGLIRLTEFDKVTVKQFETAVEQLKQEEMQYLIVDVRGNPGGLLTSVTQILDDLLDEGLLVYTKQRRGNGTEIYAENGKLFDGPVAVLVNENSASAAEVFAGVLQDYGAGPIVGRVTYGKGTVQKTFTLKDGSALKLTAEKYFTAGGQEINGVGVTPDIVTEQEADDITKAIEAMKTWNRK